MITFIELSLERKNYALAEAFFKSLGISERAFAGLVEDYQPKNIDLVKQPEFMKSVSGMIPRRQTFLLALVCMQIDAGQDYLDWRR